MSFLKEKWNSLKDKVERLAVYCWTGVWRDSSKSLKVKVIKTINLSARTFMDSRLQTQASALTYRTLLAIVPAFALLFAIGRGFNLQDLLKTELIRFFPAQHQVIDTAISFVDSYLKQASQGIFVGVGIVFLLWTLISLLSFIEDSFNMLWGVKQGRTLYRKVTDYTAICLLVPILMVCSAGINIFMNTMFDTLFGHLAGFPLVSLILDCLPFLLTCIAFTLSFFLIPNTSVSLKYAIISGVICSIAFQFIQIMFISGQMYVAKYNAIYGSFAFLPLLLIWLQISWLILLFGCTLTFSMQHIFNFTFIAEAEDISPLYMRKLTVAAAAIVITRFRNGEQPMTVGQISRHYGLPIRLLAEIVERLHKAGVFYYVLLKKEKKGIAPAINTESYTVGQLLETVDRQGSLDFVPDFKKRYGKVDDIVNLIAEEEYTVASEVLLSNIPISSLD